MLKNKLLVFFLLLQLLIIDCHAASRIKDIVRFEGIRENLLVGYGLVVGLNGTGDNLNNSVFTQKGLTDFLERLGINTRGANLKTKNIAAVTVTASLPPFSRQGSKIDVMVSTLGDAKSLQGGTLLATPLLGADGEVYAVSQGAVSIGGFRAIGNAGTTVSRGVVTNGFISNGAIIEKEIDFKLSNLDSLKLSLQNPDISTALNIEHAINERFGLNLAKALDPGTVEMFIPEYHKENIVALLAQVEKLEVQPDKSAKIIIDEASGTIVMGDNVKISPVAISQGNLTVTINEGFDVFQPMAFSPESAENVVVPVDNINIDEDRGKQMKILDKGSNLKELVDGLNALGVTPRDLINILQNIKAVGALQAEIETR